MSSLKKTEASAGISVTSRGKPTARISESVTDAALKSLSWIHPAKNKARIGLRASEMVRPAHQARN